MKTCQEHQAAIGSFVEGDLSPAEGEIIAAHLEDCADCQTVERDYRALSELLVPSLAPPARDEDPAWRRFDNELAEKLINADDRRRGMWIPAPLAAAATLLLVFTAGLSFTNNRKASRLTEDNAKLTEALFELQTRRSALGLETTRRVIPVHRVNNALRPVADEVDLPDAWDADSRDPFEHPDLDVDAHALATVDFTPAPAATPEYKQQRRAAQPKRAIRLINYDAMDDGLY